MSGGTRKHSIITTNITTEIGLQLRDTSCQGFSNDMRIKIDDTKYVYPDYTVVCGEERFADDNETMLTNPPLVVEVMSPSSSQL